MTTIAQRIDLYSLYHRRVCEEQSIMRELEYNRHVHGCENIDDFVSEYNSAADRHNTYLGHLKHHAAELRLLGMDVELDKKISPASTTDRHLLAA